jgi:hypothetical protein
MATRVPRGQNPSAGTTACSRSRLTAARGLLEIWRLPHMPIGSSLIGMPDPQHRRLHGDNSRFLRASVLDCILSNRCRRDWCGRRHQRVDVHPHPAHGLRESEDRHPYRCRLYRPRSPRLSLHSTRREWRRDSMGCASHQSVDCWCLRRRPARGSSPRPRCGAAEARGTRSKRGGRAGQVPYANLRFLP